MWLDSWNLQGLHYKIIHVNISGLLTIDVKDILVSQEETRRVIHLEPIYVLSTSPSMRLVSGLRDVHVAILD